MRWIPRLLILYLLLKPYYFFSSGVLQIGDIFLVLAFVIMFASTVLNNKVKKEFINIVNENRLFVIFTALTLMVNGLYSIYYGQPIFLLASLYFIFIIIAIILFSYHFKDKLFLRKVSKVFKFNLILQLFIFILHTGRYYDIERYMGTFNDPNQFGYYILISYLFIYVNNILLKKKRTWDIPYLLIVIYLIFQSGSTGMLLGLSAFLGATIVYRIYMNNGITYKNVRSFVYGVVIFFVLVLTIVLPLMQIIAPTTKDYSGWLDQQAITQRLTDKLSRVDNSSNSQMTIWEERGYDKIYKYPEKILYGAGEGLYDRFKLAVVDSEIHATFPSILFCYGIIPTIILLKWLYDKLKGVDGYILIAYFALIVESFTLLNQRQALFWMIIVLGSVSARGVINEKIK